MAVNVLRHYGYTIMAHPVPDEPLFDAGAIFLAKCLAGRRFCVPLQSIALKNRGVHAYPK